MSPVLKTMMTPGFGDHSNGTMTSHFLCFGTGNPYLAAKEGHMSRTLQFLIAAACIFVIACGAVFLVDHKQAADKAAADREWAAMMQRSRTEAFADAQRAKQQARVDECQAALDAYDQQGQTFAFVQRVLASGQTLTGDAMLAEVAACRDLIRSSTPSAQPE